MRSRKWAFIVRTDENHMRCLMREGVDYFISGREYDANGLELFQGVIRFTEPVPLPRVMRFLGKRGIAFPCRNNFERCVECCKTDANFIEWGINVDVNHQS